MNQGENSGEEFGKVIGQDIAQPYRAGSAEMPSVAADAAILMLARAAAAQTSTRNAAAPDAGSHDRAGAVVQMSAMRRWRAPLGLAASLVLVVGIVSRIQLEEEAGTAPGVAPAAPLPVGPSAPVAPAAPAAPAAPVEAKKLAAAAAEASPNGAGASSQAVPPQVADRAPANALAKPSASAPAMTPATVPLAAPVPLAAAAQPEDALERKKERKADVVADSPVPFPAQGGRPAGAIEGATKPEQDARAKTSAEGALPAKSAGLRNESAAIPPRENEAMNRQAAPPSADLRAAAKPALAAAVAPAVLSEQAEATLTPGEWLRRIIEARRAGRHEEADASLVRLVAKHPQLSIPAEARRN